MGLIIAYLLGTALSEIPIFGVVLMVLLYIILGYVGMRVMVKKKNDVIRIFDKFKRNRVDDKKDLEDEYSDLRSVKWVGEDKNTSKYYKNARLLINTSEYEGISNTILEAQSYGIPVVASNVGGNKDLISNYKNGILFERDSSDVIKTICEIYFNEKKILDMKSNSLEYIKNHYIENIIGKYIKQFN